MRLFKINRVLSLAFVAVTAGGLASEASAGVITQWNFPAVMASPPSVNSPAPTTGSGTAKMLGMTNSYVYSTGSTGAVANGDITSSPAVATVGFSENTWRIRAGGAGGAAAPNDGNGWNNSAPQYSQGAEFDFSTVGFNNIHFGFDWYTTNQGVRDLQEQYTTNGGTTWTNINPLLVAVPNDFYGTPTATTPAIDINLSATAGASNDPQFGIRLVSAFDPALVNTYASASLTGGVPVAYNNNSGNWRLGDITVSGTAVTAVPLPTAVWATLTTLPLLLLGVRLSRIRL